MDDSPVIEIRIDRVPKKTDWKEVGGGDRDKMESASWYQGPFLSIQKIPRLTGTQNRTAVF